jgi:hypothetical protein
VRVAALTLIAALVPSLAAAQGERISYLTFAQGAVPVSIGGAGAKLGADFERAVRTTDGDPRGFTIVNGATADTDTEFLYQLPALTTFDRFAVPNVLETPSPTATFTRVVEVHGSAAGAADGFVLLASATLQTHKARGMVTELTIAARPAVRWVKVRLVGGINILTAPSSFEFSEIIANGTQQTPELATNFEGAGGSGRPSTAASRSRASDGVPLAHLGHRVLDQGAQRVAIDVGERLQIQAALPRLVLPELRAQLRVLQARTEVEHELLLARREPGDQRLALFAAGVRVGVAVEADDAGAPHLRRMTGDFAHQRHERLAILAALLALHLLDERRGAGGCGDRLDSGHVREF